MKINTRSPYFINVTDVNLTSCTLYLYIYTGTLIADRGAIKYTLNSEANNDEVTFEISELVRDYLDITFNGSYASETVWVEYQTTKYISEIAQTPDAIVELNGFDGYGYFEDAANPQLDSALLQSNTLDYVLDGQPYVVAVNSNDTVDVKFYLGGVLQSTVLAPDTLESDEVILYASYTGADLVVIDDGVGLTNITLNTVEECKYTPIKLTFVNKFGVLQDAYFFKRSNTSLSTTKKDYKSNLLNNGTYETSKHQSRILTKQGKEKLTLNSGFVDEQYNEVFREMLLSDKVWVNYNGSTLPVNISSSSINFKTSLNDGMINYTIDLDFAYDKINNIR